MWALSSVPKLTLQWRTLWDGSDVLEGHPFQAQKSRFTFLKPAGLMTHPPTAAGLVGKRAPASRIKEGFTLHKTGFKCFISKAIMVMRALGIEIRSKRNKWIMSLGNFITKLYEIKVYNITQKAQVFSGLQKTSRITAFVPQTPLLPTSVKFMKASSTAVNPQWYSSKIEVHKHRNCTSSFDNQETCTFFFS